MAVRAFIQTWQELPNGDGIEITNPLVQYLLNVSFGVDFVALHFEAQKDGVGRPDKGAVISICRGDLTQEQWDELSTIPGVTAIPPNMFDTSLSTLPKPLENQIKSMLDAYSIPADIYTSSVTTGGLLRNVCEHLNPNFPGFGAWETLNDEWA